MKLIAVLFFLMIAFTSQAKKYIYPLEHVIGLADLIVIGEIESVEQNTYTFRITETLKGDVHATIRVEKFKEWTCDTRYAKHEKGQKLCLFLQKGLLSWNIINGSTGERPILEQTIYLGMEEDIYKLPLSEFVEGITSFCKCYATETISGAYEEIVTFRQMCTDEEIANFRSLSKFTKWLYDRIHENGNLKK